MGITGLYARTSDGKMVELTKESVASVMAGLVVSFPKYGALDDANLDDIKTVGTYTVGDGCTNKPANETWNHSMLQVVVGRNDWVTQIYYSGAYGKIYIRHFKYNATSTGEWSSWSTINFGYNTLAELSSGVAGVMNTNRVFPSMVMGNIPNNDCNNAVETGSYFYYIEQGGLDNSPGLSRFVMDVKNNAGGTCQVAYSTGLSDSEQMRQVLYRPCLNDIWLPWQRIDNFGCNTLEELASALKPLLGLS